MEKGARRLPLNVPCRSAGTRTLDPLIKSQLLYHLSYRPVYGAANLDIFWSNPPFHDRLKFINNLSD